MSQNQSMPSWVKALLAITGVAGGLIIVYYAVTSVFGAGTNAWKELYQQQYDALVKKMANYVKDNGQSQTGFTASQQAAINVETNQLAQTGNGLAAAANGLTIALVESVIAVSVTAVLGAVGYRALKIWLNRSGQTAATSYSISYATLRVIADELVQMGSSIQATNIISSAQQMFQTLSLPAMQSYQSALQADLINLTGVELLAAQQTITLLSVEAAYIPTLLVQPLPII